MMPPMVPVVDVSKWQGTINFRTMHARGVRGLIIRATHGPVIDPKLVEYTTQAVDAGFEVEDIGFYAFCNPKRSTGADAGRYLVDAARSVIDPAQGTPFLMLDVENYANESGTRPAIYGPEYADWLRAMVAVVEPAGPPVIYTNGNYWNPRVGADDFGRLGLIVARYPYYSPSAPKPPGIAAFWESWIKAQPKRPEPMPVGWADWDGWQFSAGYNAAGPVYGASSADLDLNLIRADAWARWTGVTPAPPSAGTVAPEDAAATGEDVLIIGRDANRSDPKRWIYNGQVKSDPTEHAARRLVARGMTHGTTLEAPEWWSDAEIAAVPTVKAVEA